MVYDEKNGDEYPRKIFIVNMDIDVNTEDTARELVEKYINKSNFMYTDTVDSSSSRLSYWELF